MSLRCLLSIVADAFELLNSPESSRMRLKRLLTSTVFTIFVFVSIGSAKCLIAIADFGAQMKFASSSICFTSCVFASLRVLYYALRLLTMCITSLIICVSFRHFEQSHIRRNSNVACQTPALGSTARVCVHSQCELQRRFKRD